MKKCLPVPFVIALIFAAAPFPARAQEEGYPFRFSNFSLELFGGASSFRANDFNKFVDYEEAWMKFFTVDSFDYLHSLYGNNYTYTSRQTTDKLFLRLKRAVPYGARIRYQASPTFSISIGVEFLDGIQTSDVGMDFSVTNRLPDSSGSFSYQYRNSGFELRVKGWQPTFGAHLGWNLFKILRSEIFIDFGPLFLQATAVSDRLLAYTEEGGYHWESRSKIDMKGNSTTLCGEVGTTLMVRLKGFLQLYVEGTYIFRELSQLDGPGSSLLTSSDSLGAQSSVSSSWTGQWSFLQSMESQAWGQFFYPYLQNQYPYYSNGTGWKCFDLDLSGFQLKAGLKFNF